MKRLCALIMLVACGVAHAQTPNVKSFDTNNFNWVAGQSRMRLQATQSLSGLSLTNMGLTVTRPVGATSYVWISQASIQGVFVDPRNHGAVGNGGDDTQAFQAAIASAGNGTVVVPEGDYRVNLVITNNVRLMGVSRQSGQVFPRLLAANPALPVLTVGNDTRLLDGFQISNLTLDGSSGTSDYGLAMAGGAYRGIIENCTFIAFAKKAVYTPGNAAFPVSLVTFRSCVFQAHEANNEATVDITQASNYPTTHVTAIVFDGCHFSMGVCPTGYLMRIDSVPVYVGGGSYFDQGTTGIIRIDKSESLTPYFILGGVTFDIDGGGVAFETYDDDKNVIKHFHGLARFSGKIKLTDATELTLPENGFQSYAQWYSYPYIVGGLQVQDTSAANAWEWNNDNRLTVDSEFFQMASGTRGIRLNSRDKVEIRNTITTNTVLQIAGGGGHATNLLKAGTLVMDQEGGLNVGALGFVGDGKIRASREFQFGADDRLMVGIAADIVAMRRGENRQEMRWFFRFDEDLHQRYGYARWNGNQYFEVGNEGFGTYPQRNTVIRGEEVHFITGTNTAWRINTSMNLVPETTDIHRIGAPDKRLLYGYIKRLYFDVNGTNYIGWDDSDVFRLFGTMILTDPLVYSDDDRQVFNPGDNNAGINVGEYAGDPSATIDGDLWYNSTSEILQTKVNGTTRHVVTSTTTSSLGGLQVKTSDYPATANDDRSTFSNEGALGLVTITLPTPVANLEYTFYVRNAVGFKVATAAAGQTIRIAGSVSTSGGYIDSTTVGDSVTIIALNSTEWGATSIVGTGWAAH